MLRALRAVLQLWDEGKRRVDVRDGLKKCGALYRLLPCPLPTVDGFSTRAGLGVVVRQHLRLSISDFEELRLEHARDLPMVLSSPAHQQRLVRGLLDE